MRKGIHKPKGGWINNTWYLVLKSHGASNPKHHGLLYTGFLDKYGNPGSYSGVFSLNYVPNKGDDISNVSDMYFIHPICPLVNSDGKVYPPSTEGKETKS